MFLNGIGDVFFPRPDDNFHFIVDDLKAGGLGDSVHISTMVILKNSVPIEMIQSLKKYLYRLIEQSVLNHGRDLSVVSFIVSSQTKQASCIPFIDRNFHITGTVEQYQFFSLWNISI